MVAAAAEAYTLDATGGGAQGRRDGGGGCGARCGGRGPRSAATVAGRARRSTEAMRRWWWWRGAGRRRARRRPRAGVRRNGRVPAGSRGGRVRARLSLFFLATAGRRGEARGRASSCFLGSVGRRANDRGRASIGRFWLAHCCENRDISHGTVCVQGFVRRQRCISLGVRKMQMARGV